LIYESPLVDDSGKQTGWMSSILDISDLEHAEDINRQQQEKLQSSARLAAMGEIASTLAHELNQPLAAVSSYLTGALNMIEEDKTSVSAAFKENVKPAIEKAAAQTQRAGHIIRSVHSFTKRRETNKAEINLKEMIDRITPLIELQAQRKFVTVHKAISEKLPNVLADATLIEQVLLNLTRNAIDAMEDTPAEKRILRIEAYLNDKASGRKVTVAVIDQGCGISKEVESKLFSPFFSTKADGMGMGLSICRTAVEAHGGTLRFAPNPDGGTIFSFSLPAD
jgi:two-component system sensor histidine kinase DctS